MVGGGGGGGGAGRTGGTSFLLGGEGGRAVGSTAAAESGAADEGVDNESPRRSRRTGAAVKREGTGTVRAKGKGKEALPKKEEIDDEVDQYEGDLDDDDDIDVEYIGTKSGIGDEETYGLNLNWGLNPVRLYRQEHTNRIVGVNTDASSATAAQIRQKAREAGVGASDITVIADEGSAAPRLKATSRKGKGKEIEFVRDEKKWQGVYSSDEMDEPKIKKEDSNEVEMVEATNEPTADTTVQADLSAAEPPIVESEKPRKEKDVQVKERPKVKKHKTLWQRWADDPVLQTPEDYEEWDRHKADMAALVEELRQTNMDKDGDMDMDEEGEGLRDRRENLVYLFQLPPVMPYLVTPAEARKLAEARFRAATEQGHDPKSVRNGTLGSSLFDSDGERARIKREDDIKESNLGNDTGPRLILDNTTEDKFEGHVGTLTVYEDGATTLDWGGIDFELNIGVGELLQEVVMLDPEGQEDRAAYAMSEVSATFIVTPKWESLFDAED